MSIPYETSNNSIASPQNVLSPPDRSQQQQAPQQISIENNQDAIIKYILSQPNMAEQVLRQYGIHNVAAPMVPSQQTLQQPQVSYQQQPIPYQQQTPTQIPQQRHALPASFQQPSLQPMFQQQQQSQVYQQGQMPFQQQTYFPQQQQQQQGWYQQQRRSSPSVIHYLPTNTNQPSPSATQQPPSFQAFATNDTEHMPQQFLNQLNIWNLSDRNFNQPTTNILQQQTTTDEVENIDSLSFLK
jgi:hypothetical protein